MTDEKRMEIKIGIVEPDVEVLRILTQTLQDINCQLLTYANAEKALAEWRKEGLHLFVSEWELPATSGADFCRQLQNNSSGFPIIFISELKESEVRLQALQLGALDFITKPFDRQYLLAKIKAIIALLQRTPAKSIYPKSPDHRHPPDFIYYLQQQKIGAVTPVPDVSAKFGFTYTQISDWMEKVLSNDEQKQILDGLAVGGWFEKRVYDIVKTCPSCNSFNLTVRSVCLTCHTPVLPQGLHRSTTDLETHSDTSHGNLCPQCHAELTTTLSFARCLACGKDFDEKESQVEIIYSYHLKAHHEEATLVKKNNGLIKLLRAEGFRFFSGELFEEFQQLQKHQHDLARQSFSIMKIRFLQIEQALQREETLKKFRHVLLVLKKVVKTTDTLFVLPPDMLAVFQSYTDSSNAQLNESRMLNYLERLGLSSLVEINLTTYNLSSVLELLEKDYQLEEQLP